MRCKCLRGVVLGGVLAAAVATSANATVIQYNFTLDGLSGSPLPSEPPNWGYFTVDNHGGTSELSFTVVLNSALNFYFQDDNSQHPTGTFNFLTNGTVTNITDIATTPITSPVGFAALPEGSYAAPNIIIKSDTTLFNQGISCVTDCQGGSVQDSIYGLTFDVFGTGLSLAGISNSKNYPGTAIYGSADIAYNSGGQTSTGNIGATFAGVVIPGDPVPEPSSLPLLLAGLTAIGGAMYFGRRKCPRKPDPAYNYTGTQ